ncbi:MAG: hypothetical protein V1922_01190 [bacterium]
MKKALTYFFIFTIGASIFFASWFVLHNNIYFFTDLARDFLLFEEIALTKKPILIGPRTSMQGVFHGPAWLYVNLPVFLASRGNPVAVGWFWVFLIAISICVMYFISRKLLDKQIALPITALYALAVGNTAPYLYNPFGAVLFAPLFFYFFVRYMQKHQFLHLLICLFCIGMAIQFEMVWGVPILILASILILYKIIRSKKFAHLFSFGILAIPLSTFILFDLRHQFIQLKSIIRYVVGSPGAAKQKADLFTLVITRTKDMIFVMPSYFSNGSIYINTVLTIIFILLVVLFLKSKILKKHSFISYFLYFYGGFWIVTLPIRGMIYDYYYWAFLPLFCIVVGALVNIHFKKYAPYIFAAIALFLIVANVQIVLKQDRQFFQKNTGLWSFYLGQAQSVYKNAGADFGWYVYTADQYAYSFKYAMSYTQQQFPTIRSYKFQKKPLTYLMIYPSDNKYTNETPWRTGQVKINKKPEEILKSYGGSYAEKYTLTPEDIAVPADSTLLQDLTFR